MTATREVHDRGQPEAESSASGSRVFRRAGLIGLILLPAVGLIYLSFNAGGFFPDTPGFAVIILIQALVLRTVMADRPFEGFDSRLAVPIVALALFAAWQLASSLWSHALARALDEFDRTLLYLLALVLFGSIGTTVVRIRWMLRALAGAMAAVCVIALISRLLPSAWPTTLDFASSRLSYPLTYWNAEGLLAALALIFGLHLTCDRREPPAVRVIAAGLMPAVAATMLLTFSRGALGAVVLGMVAYVVLARPSALLTGLIAVGPTVGVALRSTYDATLLATSNPTSAAALVQGRHVAKVVGVCVLVAALLRLALLLGDVGWSRWGARRPREARLAGRGGFLALCLGALVAALVLGALGFIHREYDQFVHNSTSSGGPTRARLTSGYDDRLPYWRVGIKEFEAHPLRGGGADTYQFAYARTRPFALNVLDTHSLYIQTLGELGLVGLILLLVAILGLFGLLAARIRGPDRAVFAAILAAGLAWAIHAGVDWDWQMPALTVWFFCAAGLALGRPARPRAGTEALPVASWDRPSLGIAWLLLAVAPFLVMLSFQRLVSAERALAASNCPAAKRDALSSLSYLAVRPEPYAVIGLCDVRNGYGAAAVSAMDQAVANEPGNWEYRFTLAIAQAEDGINPKPTLRRATEMNPLEPIISSAEVEFARAGPQGWAQLAPAVALYGLDSGDLNDL